VEARIGGKRRPRASAPERASPRSVTMNRMLKSQRIVLITREGGDSGCVAKQIPQGRAAPRRTYRDTGRYQGYIKLQAGGREIQAYVYVYIYTYIYTYIHTYTRIYIHIKHINIFTHSHIYVNRYIQG